MTPPPPIQRALPVMRELDAIKITVTSLEPNCERTLPIEQPYPDAVLLSHFEVTELSPQGNFAQLTDLRIGRLSYLIAPVSLRLFEREQHIKRQRAEQEALQRLQPLLGLLGPQHVLRLIKQDRGVTRLTALDIRWKPQQQLAITLKNSGTTAVDEVSIELVLYSLDGPLLSTN